MWPAANLLLTLSTWSSLVLLLNYTTTITTTTTMENCSFQIQDMPMPAPVTVNHRAMGLTDLPIELFLMIAAFLLPVDRLCLALCNHDLLSLLMPDKQGSIGHDLSSQNYRDDKGETLEFVTRLTRDLPPYYVCLDCEKLHLWQKINPPEEWQYNRCNTGSIVPWINRLGPFCYGPGIHHVHLAIRRFQHGYEYGIEISSLENLAIKKSTYERKYPSSNFFRIIPLLSVEASIYSPNHDFSEPRPSLCLRIQLMSALDNLGSKNYKEEVLEVIPYICGDLGYCHGPVIGRTEVSGLIYNLFTDQPTEQFSDASCPDCNTMIKLRGFQASGRLYVVLTKWLELKLPL